MFLFVDFLVIAAEAAAWRCSLKGALQNFTKLIWKRQCQSLFFNVVSGMRSATLFKKGCGAGVFLQILPNF